MTRELAEKIYQEEDHTARSILLSHFHASHPLSVVEALVIWAQLPDCPPKLADRLDELRDMLQHVPEFRLDPQ